MILTRDAYVEELRRRMVMAQRLRDDPQLVAACLVHYRENPIDFIQDWGVTIDPRLPEKGLPSLVPFRLFPRQVEMAQFVLDRYAASEPGVIPKSRDVGATWVMVALGCALCLFRDGLHIGYGSRKEEYVDKADAPKAMFPRARQFLQYVPAELRRGWSDKRHAPHMRISFPATGSVMTGEAGDNIGRGDRASIYFVDEAQPLRSRVLTPTGWVPIGGLAPGDRILHPSGREARVEGVRDHGSCEVLRLHLSDGTFAECSPNHLWAVDRVWGKKSREVKRAREIAEDFEYRSPGGQVQYRYRVPMPSVLHYDEGPALPLDPYVVGALLGDGSVSGKGSVRITSADPFVFDEVAARLPPGCELRREARYSARLVAVDGRGSRGGGRMKGAVAAAGMIGLRSWEKRIPEAYLRAPPEDRLALLQGLMDTDGSCTKGGSAGFYSSSEELASGVCELVRSLGGFAKLNRKSDARGYRDQYTVRLALPEGGNPFRLPRKAERYVRSNRLSRAIVRVERMPAEPVRCLTTSEPDGLYLTDDFIVTHNCAFLERPQKAEASLSATTNCRIDLSSANGMDNPFAEKVHSWPAERVFRFHWRDDPRKSDAWYADQCERLPAVVVAQEIDLNFTASKTGIVIPSEWVQAAIGAAAKLGVAVSGERVGSLDVADEGVDLNAWAGRYGIELQRIEAWSGKGSDVAATAARAVALCDDYGARTLRYDADGLGSGVRGDVRLLNEHRHGRTVVAEAFRGSGAVVNAEKPIESVRTERRDPGQRLNRDMFANFKAQAWHSVRLRFERTFRAVTKGETFPADQLISISPDLPDLAALIAELSQPTWAPNGTGKLVVDKAPDGTRSPNRADAVMMIFAPTERRARGILSR